MKGNMYRYDLCHVAYGIREALIRDYGKFAKLPDDQIRRIFRELSKGRYRWSTMFRKYIPKAPGKVGERPLTIPTLRDRLVQRGMHLSMPRIYDHTFSAKSHGFRPGRGCISCYQAIGRWRQVRRIVLLDVTGCFDNVPQAVLTTFLTPRS